jgi:hypothetical protein
MGAVFFFEKLISTSNEYTGVSTQKAAIRILYFFPFVNIKLIRLGQDIVELRALLNAVLYLRVSQEARIFLTCRATILSHKQI